MSYTINRGSTSLEYPEITTDADSVEFDDPDYIQFFKSHFVSGRPDDEEMVLAIRRESAATISKD